MSNTLIATSSKKQSPSSKIKTMLAAVLVSPAKMEIRKTRMPEPGPEEVLVRLSGCGVCPSSKPVWQGRDWYEYPLNAGAPGHEGWGIVESTGEKVVKFKAGQPVTLISNNAFAEFDVAHQNNIIALPPGINGTYFPGEPLGRAMSIFERADIQAGHTVGIIGLGFIGSLLAKLAKDAGAKVIAISRRDYSLKKARENGADETLSLDDQWRMVEQVKEITGGDLCDRVIETAGKQFSIDLGTEITRDKGKFIIAGYHNDGLRNVNMQLWNLRGLDVINAFEKDHCSYINGIKMAVNAVEKGVLDVNNLFTHSFSLDALNDAFILLHKRPSGFVKSFLDLS